MTSFAKENEDTKEHNANLRARKENRALRGKESSLSDEKEKKD